MVRRCGGMDCGWLGRVCGFSGEESPLCLDSLVTRPVLSLIRITGAYEES